MAAARGDPERSDQLLRDALRSNDRHPDPFGLRTDFLCASARIALDAGRIADAADLSREALHDSRDRLQDQYEYAWQESLCCSQLGEIALAEADATLELAAALAAGDPPRTR